MKWCLGFAKSRTWLSDWTELNQTYGTRCHDLSFLSVDFLSQHFHSPLSLSSKDSLLLLDFCHKGEVICIQFSSLQFNHSVVSNSLRPHELQHTRPPYPSPSPGVHSNSCPLSQWCHPAISSSVVPLSSCPQSLPASESFPMSQHFAWGGQSTGASALTTFLPKKSQDWSP